MCLDKAELMFHFICDHIVPGCTHVDEDESRQELLERVANHLREHHDLDHTHDTALDDLLKRTIMPIRPV
jgi:predicted small metal-binding protein